MNAFCTIITSDHIHYALAVRKSLLDFRKDINFHILIADRKKGLKERIENNYSNTQICFAQEICNSGIGKAIYTRYYQADMDAFRWSMKPVFINYLLQEKNYEKVIYTDCDIHFYNDYHFLLNELDQYNVLISPHWRSSDPHVDLPNFEILYTKGIYNGGFIGANKHAVAAMNWWAMACEFICIKDSTIGMFVDQVHLNLLPVYFDNVGIVKHRGCNVANWNMVECKRSLSADLKTLLIADQYPVVFVHFTRSMVDGIVSGADPLLMPHLQQYYSTINRYASELDLPDPAIPESKKGNYFAKKNHPVSTDNFLNIELQKSNLDLYYTRKSILHALKETLPVFKGRLLDIGCGKMPYKEFILTNSAVEQYVGLDIETALDYDKGIKPDHTWNGITMPFENESFESAFGTEVLEHCPEPGIVLNEVYRVLKPGGSFFFTVPFLWPLHEVPNDASRYTPFILQRLLRKAGFREIQVKATGGWHASMAQMLGLWVRRSPMGSRKRKILSVSLKPLIRYLLKIEKFSKPGFNEGQMITGLSGVAYK